MSKLDILIYNYTNIQELIRFMDQKAGALLVVYGFLFTATIEFAKNLDFINPFTYSNDFKIVISIFTFLVGFSLTILLTYQVYIVIFKVIKPREAIGYTQEENSIIYYKHISTLKKNEYLDHIKQLPEIESDLEDTLQKELSSQIHEISRIMAYKSEKFNFVLNILFLSIFLLLLFILLSNFL
ncbi:hypothetical protein [Gracilibacillus suaedae]|uniref:hypothetical protein n=1 Tax=Gracilibacillus suaedae TaxID=2820273 RepID=UPI001ABDD203|nr:hypothetical protein [Gracilibacillus suaedae]